MLRAGDGPSKSVYRLSEQLCTLGYLADAGAFFGPDVDEAVKGFQRANGLTVDGVYGPASAARLEHEVGGRRVESIIVHHTAGSRTNTAADIDAYHRQVHPSWGGVAYQYVISQPRDGVPLCVLEKGRTHAGGAWLEGPGTHVMGIENARSIAVCVVGDFSAAPMPGPLYRTLVGLVSTWCSAWDLTSDDVRGHHEVPGNETSCPGDTIDLDQLRTHVAGVLDALPAWGTVT